MAFELQPERKFEQACVDWYGYFRNIAAMFKLPFGSKDPEVPVTNRATAPCEILVEIERREAEMWYVTVSMVIITGEKLMWRVLIGSVAH